MEKGIYINQEPTGDLIGYYASELSTCERLLKMGYVTSNNVNLESRAQWLDREITRIENLRRGKRSGLSEAVSFLHQFGFGA